MINRANYRAALDEAATQFDQHSEYFKNSGSELCDRLTDIPFSPRNVVDVGCRTGWVCQQLSTQMPEIKLIGLDESKNMVALAKNRLTHLKISFAVSDSDCLPIQSNSIDLIVSNLASSFYHPEYFLRECYRVLRHNGVLMFSMFGLGAFQELKNVHYIESEMDVKSKFHDLHTIGDLLPATGFSDSVVDVEYFKSKSVNYQSFIHQMTYAGVLPANSSKSQLKPSKKVFNLNLEIVFGIAWKKEITASSTSVPFYPR